jgi:Uma2 family endonuclease
MSMPATLYYSAEMVRNLPDDGNRYETVHGELLVTPSPRMSHQEVLLELILMLGNYLKSEGVRGLLCSPADISWGPDTLVQPDLFVVDAEEMKSKAWADVQTLHLVIEILSPSSTRADRFTKRRLYQEQHVATYWIVDVDHQQVEIWTPEARFPVVERERLTWRHPAAAAECVVELATLFSG